MSEVYGLPGGIEAVGNGADIIETEVVEPPRMLTIDQILNAPDVQEHVMEVPEWGGSVKLRGFTKGQQQHFKRQATIKGEINEDRLEMLMFINGVVEPKFSTDQIELLREKSFGVVERILAEILKLSGLSATAVKDAERNFRS